MSSTVAKDARLVVGILAASAVVVWGLYRASNEIFFHGFSPSCSDGSPDYDPEYCGISWAPGLPYIAVVAAGLVALALIRPERSFHRGILLGVGLFSVVLALILLWSGSWDPVNSQYPEPAEPQVVLLGFGAAVTAVGLRLPRAPEPARLPR